MSHGEAHVRFPTASGLELEGLLRRGVGQQGAVVCHPHPLHGGDMHNPVVAAASQAFAVTGRAVLRFNFRGTGGSQGTHGGGRVEGEDLLGAIAFMAGHGVREICLVGYSFGAYVVAHLPDTEHVHARILIAPPVQVMDFSAVGAVAGLRLVVTGSLDALAPPDAVASVLPGWSASARLEVVQGADHFFVGGRLHELCELLV